MKAKATTNGRLLLSLEGIERALARSKEGHQAEYIATLRRRVAKYEKRYKMPSAVLRDALSSNDIKENLDIVKWLHAHDSLLSLENGGRGKARMERIRGLSSRAGTRDRR